MKRLVEFPSDTGESILVEVEDVGLAGETRRGLSPSAVVERAQSSFEDALEKARPMASSLVGKLRAIGEASLEDPRHGSESPRGAPARRGARKAARRGGCEELAGKKAGGACLARRANLA